MNISVLNSLSRRRRKEEALPAKTVSPGQQARSLRERIEEGLPLSPLSEKEEGGAVATGKGVTKGYWTIPQGGSYLKLKILPTYTVRHGLGQEGVKLSPITNGRLIPVWPVLAGVDKLGKYFTWIKKTVKSITPEVLTDPANQGHEEGIRMLQRKLMQEEWAFVFAQGTSLTISSHGSPEHLDYYPQLIEELFLGKLQAPQSVALDTSKTKKLVLTDPEGRVVKTLDVADIRATIQKEQNSPELAEFLARLPSLSSSEFVSLFGDKEKLKQLILIAYRTNRGTAFFRAIQQLFNDQRASGEIDQQTILRIVSDFGKVFAEAKKELAEAVSLFEGTLTELSFRKLWALTQQNGGYRKGGMVMVHRTNSRGEQVSSWGYDPNVKGRIQNGTRFVVKRPPKVTTASDGNPQLLYNFKSRTGRSTTGLRQKGYIKFLPERKSIWKRFTGLFTKKGKEVDEWDKDIHIFCTCPDFKFRWHKALYDAGASHQPQGGAEATNEEPLITNPGKKLCMCKHQVAAGAYLSMSKAAYDKIGKEKDNMAKAGLQTVPGIGHPPVVMPGKTPDVDAV